MKSVQSAESNLVLSLAGTLKAYQHNLVQVVGLFPSL